MLDKFLKYFVATFLLISGFAVKAQIPGMPGIPGMGGGKSTSTVDLLTQSLGLDADSKKIQQALADSKNPNTSESDRMANAIKATTETTKALEEKNKAGTIILDVKAKEKYAKSIPFAVKGLIGTLELKPKTTQMVSSIQANPIMAAQDLGALAKVIPEVPNYITTIVSVTKLIVTGAEANNIDTKELKSTLGKF
jgi:hypothetical protein